MTSVRNGVLGGRASAVAVFILFSCLGVWSWSSITSSHHLARDPIYVGGLLFAIFITGSIAYRSPLSMDRVAFAAAAVAFLFAMVAAVAPFGPTAILVLRGAKSLMWTLAAVVGLVVVVRGPENVHGKG
jgi:hypothetical protein